MAVVAILSTLKRDALWQELSNMPTWTVRRNVRQIEALLLGRWPEVRVAAVEALIRGGVGSEALRTAVHRETNAVVLTVICEALMTLGDRKSVPSLKRLARHHPSALVRRAALWAVSELLQRDALPLLRTLDRTETNRRVRVGIKSALLKNGQQQELPSLLKFLKSRDYLVRT